MRQDENNSMKLSETKTVMNVGDLPDSLRERYWVAPFLEALARTANVAAACRVAQISRVAVYALKKNNPEFSDLWQLATDNALDQIELQLMDRAVKGVIQPQFYKGKLIVDKDGNPIGPRQFSDSIAIFLLKVKRYKSESIEVTGKDGGPIQHEHTLKTDAIDKIVEKIVDRKLKISGRDIDEDQIIEADVLQEDAKETDDE